MILIGLGANLPSAAGPPERTLHEALRRLSACGAAVAAVSRFYATPAWPDQADPPFVNAAAMLESALAPDAMMTLLAETETAFGRSRGLRNAPRTLDLDLLDYDGRIAHGALELPHPRLETRGFVLIPVADLLPGWVHPVSGKAVAELIAALPAGGRDSIRPFYP